MRRMLFFLLFIMFFPTQIFAGVGGNDNRYYVSDEMWMQDPYKKFVLLTPIIYRTGLVSSVDEEGNISTTTQTTKIPFSTCTAQYISPNLILSAGHCVKKQQDETFDYTAQNCKGEEFDIKLVYTQYDLDKKEFPRPTDWAVWLIPNKKYYSNSYFNMETPRIENDSIKVINAGWGFVRIISNSELKSMRKIFNKISNKNKGWNIDNFMNDLEEQLSKAGIQPLRDVPNKLKASKCEISNKKCTKIDCNKYFPELLYTTCDVWQGNSGGGFVSYDSTQLYGIVHGGSSSFYDEYDFNYMTSSIQFKDKVKELINIYDSKNSPEENIAKIPKDVLQNQANTTQSKETNQSQQITAYQLELTDLGQELEKNIPNANSMSDEKLRFLIDKLVEYDVKKEQLKELQKAYEEAKANEQSLANRTLTALTVAATGIGGMQLAQGLSEQKADKEAEANMAAYIETMRCTYGDGKQVKAGPEEIELPGANDAELMKLRAEYLALAVDLKERKEALGMKPGIESEIILDRSQTGLYDDENIGITNSAYASLYRAKALNSETDQAKIDEDKKTSKNRVVAGGVLAGVGVVGGIVGNSMINGKKVKNNKNDSDIKKKMNELCSIGGCNAETIKNMNDDQMEKVVKIIAQMKQLNQQGNADNPELDLGNIGEVLKIK